MIETVAIQDEMTQQTSLLDHSEEQVWYNYYSLIHATSPVYALVHLLLLIFAVLLCFFFLGSAVVTPIQGML
jgi:hypothetical protein